MNKITTKELKAALFPTTIREKYKYLGYIEFYTDPILVDFIKRLDKIVKPWYVPRLLLRLLHLYGNGNSIVRFRNYYISNMRNRLLDSFMINDMKWKYQSFRIYTSWENVEIENLIKETCTKIEKKYEGTSQG